MSKISSALRRLLAQGLDLMQNPVFLKETRSLMRGPRAFIIISLYLLVVGGLVGMVYLAFTADLSAASMAEVSQSLGKSIFATVVGLNLVMISFLAPGLTAGAISAERERQTYELLRTTLLSPVHLVHGKMGAALSFLLVLLTIGFPLQALAYWFGGVSLEEVLISALMLAVCAATFSALGIFVSTLFRSTLVATIVSYLLSAMTLFGSLVMLGFVAAFSGLTYSYNLNPTQELMFEVVLFSIGYLLVAVNPLAASVASEVMLMEEQQIFYTTLPLSQGFQYPVISPWIPFCVLSLLFSLVLIRLAIWAVKRRGSV